MISTKGRYALRVMIDLTEHADEGYVPLKDIAERQDISKKYLEIIMKDLVGAKLVAAASGKGGGYKLMKDPKEYRVFDILETAEGSLAIVSCLKKDSAPCPRASFCKTLPMWEEFDSMVTEFFSSKTLYDISR
jgi:Rrf2 family protein